MMAVKQAHNECEEKTSPLGKIQEIVDKWLKEIGGGYWPPLSMLANLVEEVGELAKVINALEGPKRNEDIKKEDVASELGDVFFSLICIANYYDINLEECIKRTIEKYNARKVGG